MKTFEIKHNVTLVTLVQCTIDVNAYKNFKEATIKNAEKKIYHDSKYYAAVSIAKIIEIAEKHINQWVYTSTLKDVSDTSRIELYTYCMNDRKTIHIRVDSRKEELVIE